MLSLVIVKAVLHDDKRIPPDVVVSSGFGPRTKSFTAPVYVLSRKDMVVVEDEQPVPPIGLAHPLPPEAPRWMGPIGNVPQVSSQAEESQVGDAPMSIQDSMEDTCFTMTR